MKRQCKHIQINNLCYNYYYYNNKTTQIFEMSCGGKSEDEEELNNHQFKQVKLYMIGSYINEFLTLEQKEAPKNEKGCPDSSRKRYSSESQLQMIEALKRASTKGQQQILETFNSEDGDHPIVCTTNLWDYIVMQFNLGQEYFQENDHINTLDGVYFKYITVGEGDKFKKLLVFSQLVEMGDKALVVSTIRDMTYWLGIEKQKNLSTIQTVAFASAAHEFRNPLNAIVQSLDLLEPLIDLRRGRPFFTVAKNCSNLMLFLVRDILDFSQLEAKSLILNFQPTPVLSILEECVSVLKFKADEKQIGMFIEYDIGSLPEFISTDANRFKQIIINLVSKKYIVFHFASFFKLYKQSIRLKAISALMFQLSMNKYL